MPAPAPARLGFSLIEVLVVVAIFGISAAATLPFLGQFRQKQTASTLQQDVFAALRRAQQRSVAGERDTPWGVRFLSGSYVLYAGNSYATRITGLDRTSAVRGSIAGPSEVNFALVSGMPSGTGTLTITTKDGEIRTISVSKFGGISLSAP